MTVTVRSATVMFVCRDSKLVFGLTATRITPGPVPSLALSDTQATLTEADHGHAACAVLTVTSNTPPPAAICCEPGCAETLQSGATCVTRRT